MNESVLSAIRDAVGKLARRNGLEIVRESEDNIGAEILYKNRTTGLRIVVDWTEFRPFLWISRLGEHISTPQSTLSLTEEIFQEIDVDAILLQRAPKEELPVGKMLGDREVRQVRKLLEEYADSMATLIPEVFRGDFRIVELAERHLRSRETS
jgi:hypothetical protein